MKAKLILEDGSIFEGKSFGYEPEDKSFTHIGEIVFNTSMAGYQEILTDPSYTHQIVTMTYPLIGNYGVNTEDVESKNVHVEGFIVREYQPFISNFRANKTLGDYLKENKIPGIEGIDTRRLTRHIREQGALRGIISFDENGTNQDLIEKVQAFPVMEGKNLAKQVSCTEPYQFTDVQPKEALYNIVAIDLGIKTNILRMLAQRGCSITVVPYNYPVESILKLNPDGIFLSNGPGDPAAVDETIEILKQLMGKKPIFGICLGHQLICHALGAKTYKLKFGHHGGNHPVQNLASKNIEITSQNHGFSVDPHTLPADVEVSHINLNDDTVEGIRHKKLPIFSVQYHPESAPGPHDSSYLFDEYINILQDSK